MPQSHARALRVSTPASTPASTCASTTAPSATSPPRRSAEPMAIDPSSLRAVVLSTPTALLADDLQPGWAALADVAAEPNVFYEPWVLGPALATFGHRHDLTVVVVLADAPTPRSSDAPAILLGLFPLEHRPPAGDLPLPHLSLWTHDYLYVPVPLVHRDFGRQVLATFFDWLATQALVPALLRIEKLPVGGPFHQLLVEELDRRGTSTSVHVTDRYVRAVMAPSCDGETYQARALAGKHRKELRRRRKRLAELGELQFQSLPEPAADTELDTFIERFLSLEAGGWKGESGSALASQSRDARFFREMICACHRAGRLQATVLEVDGRALAMQTLLRSGPTSYAFKMAYDESFSRFSPGVLLVLDLVERIAGGDEGPAAGRESRYIDSVADRHHPMVNQLFTERRNVESLVVAVGSATSVLLSFVSFLPVLRATKRWAKRLVARAFTRKSGGLDASSLSVAVLPAS